MPILRVNLDWFFERLASFGSRDAIIWKDKTFSYSWLLEALSHWDRRLQNEKIGKSQVIGLLGDYSPESCAIFLSLLRNQDIAAPLSPTQSGQIDSLLRLANAQACYLEQNNHEYALRSCGHDLSHPLLTTLTSQGRPGVLLFTSGSTGVSKAILHDAEAMFEKFKKPRPVMRTISFLTLDHMGGINTMLYILANGGTMICVPDRRPDTICKAIENHRVELLPTTPSFLNLMLLSEAYAGKDLSSLKKITYGTEVMPDYTLARARAVFPQVDFQQTYGLSELGVLRTKSRSSDSKWVRIGGEDVETKVQDGTLWIRSKSAMLGYLNAPSPFDADGWYNTEDMVETDGEFVLFLGRRSEIINVAGQKVFPAEVEDVLMTMPEIEDVTVRGEKNPIFGTVVAATVKTSSSLSPDEFRLALRAFCRGKLAPYKIPVTVALTDQDQHNHRFKRIRRPSGENQKNGREQLPARMHERTQ